MRARVFISCGQDQNSDEVQTAQAIATRLQSLGFDPYIAVQEQSLSGLVENIYSRLSSSEYFLFIDFKRERIGESNEHRGSLFSHQELAIASYAGLELLAFQERGVRPLDGIMRFLQANAIPFTDRHLLANVIADKVVERGWHPDWRRALRLERDSTQYMDGKLFGESQFDKGRLMRFFHGIAHNEHRAVAAVHTYVYLDSIKSVASGAEQPFKAAEIKWAGYVYPNAMVRPGERRLFDCCHVEHSQPSVALFNVFADSTEFTPVIRGPGQYRLRFSAFSDRFPPASLDLRLTLGKIIEEAKLEVFSETD